MSDATTTAARPPTLSDFGLAPSVYPTFYTLRRKLTALAAATLFTVTALLAINLYSQGVDDKPVGILLAYFTLVFYGWGHLWRLCYPILPGYCKKLSSIASQVRPYEAALTRYYQDSLEHFYAAYLYRKRSDNPELVKSLLSFGSLLQETTQVNTQLITSKISIEKYVKYYDKRSVHMLTSKTKSGTSLRSNTETAIISTDLPQITLQSPPPQEVFRCARKIDWQQLNLNRALRGLRGEEIVAQLESQYLSSLNCKDLAKLVRHVATIDGDGLGYDILSYFPNGAKKYIEVKSTESPVDTPFYISDNELRFLQEHPADAFVYRLQITHDKNAIQLKTYSALDVVSSDQIQPTQYRIKVTQ